MIHLEELSNEYQGLVRRAMEIRENAYAPHSGFKVGSAVLTKKGNIYTGVNIETDIWTGTIHAEQMAIANAVMNKDFGFLAMATVVDSSYEKMSTACGFCRQIIHEHAARSGIDTIIMDSNLQGEILQVKISEVLPHAFAFIPDVKK